MSDFGNTASPSGDIGPDAAPNYTYPASIPNDPPQSNEQPMTHPSPSLDEQGQSDMNAITDAFDRARNAVINASQLAKDVAELREAVNAIREESERQVASLRSEVETLRGESAALRERNAMLDEHLVHARRQRDEERERNYELTRQLSTLTVERDSLVNKVNEQDGEITLQRRRINDLLTDNDHFAQMIDELEKERDALRSKLAAIQAVFAPQPSGPAPQGSQPDHYEDSQPQSYPADEPNRGPTSHY